MSVQQIDWSCIRSTSAGCPIDDHMVHKSRGWISKWAGGLVGWGGAKVPCLPARNPPIGTATQQIPRGTARQPPRHSIAHTVRLCNLRLGPSCPAFSCDSMCPKAASIWPFRCRTLFSLYTKRGSTSRIGWLRISTKTVLRHRPATIGPEPRRNSTEIRVWRR